jgi:hypothetical protein
MSVYRPKYRDVKTQKLVETDVYWVDFTYRKQRIRESTGQTKLTLARQYEKDLRQKLENAKAGVATEKTDNRLRTLRSVLTVHLETWTTGKKRLTKDYIQDRCDHLLRLLVRSRLRIGPLRASNLAHPGIAIVPHLAGACSATSARSS